MKPLLQRLGSGVRGRPWLAFLCWAAACSFAYWAFGAHSYVRIPDNADSTLAAKIGMAGQFATYGLECWWTQALSGGPLFAQGLAASLDMLFFAALPGWLAYALLMFLQRWLAGWFMYKLLRETVSLRIAPAVYAGMAYALFMQPWRNASWEGFTTYDGLILPALPFLAWALYTLAEREGFRRYAFAALLGAFAALGANIVYTAFLVPVAVCWAWLVAAQPMRRLGKPLAVFLCVYAVLSLIVNIPALLHAPLSYRADWPMEAQWFGWPYHLRVLRHIVASNALPLLLMAAGILAGAWKAKAFRRGALLLVLALAAFAAKPAYTWAASEWLGFLNGVAFERVYLGLPFLFIAAGAMGLHAIMQRLHAKQSLARTVAAIAITLVLLSYIEQTRRILTWMAAGSNYAATFEQPQVRALARRTAGEPPFRVATVMANRYLRSERYGLLPQYNAAFAWPAGLESADGYSFLYPERYQDYWARVMAPMFKRFPAYERIYTVRGNRVELFLPGEAFGDPEAVAPFGEYCNLDALSALNVRYVISNFKLADPRLALVSDGTKYLKERASRRKGFALLEDYINGKRLQIPVYIYENLQAKPRVYTMPDSVDAHVTLLRYTPGEVRVRVRASAPCTLVHAANYAPGWEAVVNGRRVSVQPRDGALQSVNLPSGWSGITFVYRGW